MSVPGLVETASSRNETKRGRDTKDQDSAWTSSLEGKSKTQKTSGRIQVKEKRRKKYK